MRTKVLSLLVENTSGVLSHISGLFSRRGYNIDSFSAGETADPRVTRATVVCSGEEEILEQIEKQLAKLEDVLYIKELKPEDSVCRELLLVKVGVSDTDRESVISVTNIFRANIIDVTNESMTIELTGTKDKLNAFLSLLENANVLEIARTGITGLSRGAKNVQDATDLLKSKYE